MTLNISPSWFLRIVIAFSLIFLFGCDTVDDLLVKIKNNDRVPPSIPQNLVTSNISSTVATLSWNASTDNIEVKNYVVYQNDIQVSTDSVTSIQVTGLVPETTYTYAVRAIDKAGNISDFSPKVQATTEKEANTEEKDTIPPTTPTNLIASNTTQTSTDLSWISSIDEGGVKEYVVYQEAVSIATVTDTTYQVTGLSANTEYRFTVRTYDLADNESPFSNEVLLTTKNEVDTTPPTAPSDLIAINTTQTMTDLSWTESTDNIGVTLYAVYQDGVSIATVTETTYQVTNLSASTDYNFTVSALDSSENESLLSNVVSITTPEHTAAKDKILVFSKTAGFRHKSISKGINTIKELGTANNFTVDQTENATDFNTDNLQKYKAVVFLSTTGDVLNQTQQIAFENYIKEGGSFMGIHSATDTEYDWSWYGQLVGAYFNGHPAIQEATINVINNTHAATAHLSTSWVRTDEWYNFKDISSNITVLLTLDESSYSGGTNAIVHPIAWYHEFDGGRSFYTGGGHTEASFDEPDFRVHLLGGIKYCLGRE